MVIFQGYPAPGPIGGLLLFLLMRSKKNPIVKLVKEIHNAMKCLRVMRCIFITIRAEFFISDQRAFCHASTLGKI